MAFSFSQFTGDGSTTAYTFSFVGQDDGYIRDSDIVVEVDEVAASFTLTSSNTLELDSPPANGSIIVIRRVMPKDEPYADFKRGNNFGQDVLNSSFLQSLYVIHEALDGWFPEDFSFREFVTFVKDVTVNADLSVNGEILLTTSDSSKPDAAVNFASGDVRYVNVTGDTMTGGLNVRTPVAGTEPAQKSQLDSEIATRISEDSRIVAQYQAADANLQAQISGGAPLEASAFSPVSWHDQEISNSVTVPDGKNAWSFGPRMTLAPSTTVTVGSGSVWTVAEGGPPNEVNSVTANAPLVQTGTAEDPVIDLPDATPGNSGAMPGSDKTKLDGIESGATADQTDAQIKAAYENNADTNAFTDSEKSLVGQLETDTGWSAITLQNGWADFGGTYQTARYKKDETGTVYVEGLISGGTITTNTVLFNLPAGFRPAADLRMGLLDASANTSGVDVESGGDVTAQSLNSNTFLSINMVFKAA